MSGLQLHEQRSLFMFLVGAIDSDVSVVRISGFRTRGSTVKVVPGGPSGYIRRFKWPTRSTEHWHGMVSDSYSLPPYTYVYIVGHLVGLAVGDADGNVKAGGAAGGLEPGRT